MCAPLLKGTQSAGWPPPRGTPGLPGGQPSACVQDTDTLSPGQGGEGPGSPAACHPRPPCPVGLCPPALAAALQRGLHHPVSPQIARSSVPPLWVSGARRRDRLTFHSVYCGCPGAPPPPTLSLSPPDLSDGHCAGCPPGLAQRVSPRGVQPQEAQLRGDGTCLCADTWFGF